MPNPHQQNQATITAATGPGRSLSAALLKGITQIHVDAEKRILELYYGNNNNQQFEIGSATSISISISGSTFTVTMS